MKKMGLLGILMLVSALARAEQCYFTRSSEVSGLAKELRGQNILPANDTNLLNFLLVSLNNERIGITEDQMRHVSVYVRTSLEEIRNHKLEKELKKVALKQLEDGYDAGKYSQLAARELWTEFYAPRISGIVKGRRNFFSRISEVLESAEASDCVQRK